MPLSESHLAVWLFAFARLAGWTLLDPLLGRMPVSIRLLIAAALAAVLAPGLAVTTVSPLTLQGLLMLGMEMLWGAALALCVWVLFAAVQAVWVWSGHTASAGLLTLTAEQAAPADAAWRALAGWLAAMAFLAAGGHLLIIDALRDSFAAMPLANWPAADALQRLAEAGGWLFAVGLQLALPLLAWLVLVQLAWTIVARTTPGLDMFSVGTGLGAFALLVGWISAVPLVAAGVHEGIGQLAIWFSQLVPR